VEVEGAGEKAAGLVEEKVKAAMELIGGEV